MKRRILAASQNLSNKHWRLTLRPRIVFVSESQPIGQRRVCVQPDFDERTWVGIGQINLAENLESFGGGFRRIGHYAVNHLQPVNVSLVFLISAEAAENRLGQKEKQIQQQQERRKGRPVVQTAHCPSPLLTGQQ